MKAIINGKTYNTETATELGSDSSIEGRSDFNWWQASLYRTRKGAYFVAGEGGARSPYACAYGQNGSQGGERIDPMTEAEAFDWAQRHLSANKVEEHFGHLIEEA